MKKSIILVLVLSLSAFICLANLINAESYVIGSFPIPLVVEDKDDGVFVELTKEIAKRVGIQIEILVAPPPRTLHNFEQNLIIGLFPGLDVTMPKKEFSRSASIYVKRDFSFFQKGKGLATIKDLEGKKVGLTNGYPYVKELTENKNILFEFVEDDVLNMKKLGAGRIQAFVVEEKSGLEALKKAGETNIEYNKDVALSEQDVYYAFQNTPQGRELANKFSKALEEMKKDGTFAKIMAKAN